MTYFVIVVFAGALSLVALGGLLHQFSRAIDVIADKADS